MGEAFLKAIRDPSLRGWRIFLIHQCIAAWGPVLVAPAMVILPSEVGWHLGFRTYLPQGQRLLYGTPFFPTQVGLALFVGWVLAGTLPHRAMLRVWVLPLAALCLALVGILLLPAPSPASVLFPPINGISIRQVIGLGLRSRLRLFFGWGVGLQPYIQVVATLPLYSAAAYSLGAWLSRKALRTPVFFETMRNLRSSRLLLFVALPWFCLKLALNWQQASAQYPVLRTWPVFRALLVMLAMGSVFVTFVFALVVGIVGRRFFLTRFFLNPGRPT